MLLLSVNVSSLSLSFIFFLFAFLNNIPHSLYFALPAFTFLVNDVQQSNCSTGAIRLTGGSNEYEGRVELCVNGVWGSVCDYGWDQYEADTVCKQLGYRGNFCSY